MQYNYNKSQFLNSKPFVVGTEEFSDKPIENLGRIQQIMT